MQLNNLVSCLKFRDFIACGVELIALLDQLRQPFTTRGDGIEVSRRIVVLPKGSLSKDESKRQQERAADE